MMITRDILESYTRDKPAERAYNRSLSSGTFKPAYIGLGCLALACLIGPRLLSARYPSLNTVLQYINYLGYAALFGLVVYAMNPKRKRSASGGNTKVTCSHCNSEMESVTVEPKRREISLYNGHHITVGQSGTTYVHSRVANKPYVYTVSQHWYVCEKCKRGFISRKCSMNEIVGDMNPPPLGSTTGADIVAKIEGRARTRKTTDQLSKKKIVIKKDG
jgi:hypothetical protein